MILDSRKLPLQMKPTLVGEECTMKGTISARKAATEGINPFSFKKQCQDCSFCIKTS